MNGKNPSQESPSVKREFATTRWSLVVAAGEGSSPQSRRALESLCEIYWYPLYAYARRRVSSVHEAQDATQAFFAELLEKKVVESADADRGRFRSFLLTAFQHFLAKRWKKAKAKKRGGGKAPLSLDFESADSKYRFEPVDRLSADQLYIRQWAITLLAHILEKLQRESDCSGKSKQFQKLKGFVIGDHQGATYARVATDLGITEAAAKKAASRLRQRYRQVLREEIAAMVANPDNVDDEIRELFAILSL